MAYLVLITMLVILIFLLRTIQGSKGFISDGLSIKDLIVLVMCFTMIFVMISYIWIMDELMKFLTPENALPLITLFLKYMLYIILIFIIPFGVAVTYYFLSEKNADGITKIIESLKEVIPKK